MRGQHPPYLAQPAVHGQSLDIPGDLLNAVDIAPALHPWTATDPVEVYTEEIHGTNAQGYSPPDQLQAVLEPGRAARRELLEVRPPPRLGQPGIGPKSTTVSEMSSSIAISSRSPFGLLTSQRSGASSMTFGKFIQLSGL